jgi:glycosyltransferase involved in cell wall biosynthesis
VGAAIYAGISIASGEIIMPVMGDAADSASDVVTIARKAQEGYDIVVGNRFMKKDAIIDYPPLKYYTNRLCNLLVRLLFRIPTSDMTNAFKAYSVKALKSLDLSSTGYSIFLELPVKAYMNGARRLAEVPVSHIATRKRQDLRIFRDGMNYFSTLITLYSSYAVETA